MDDIRSTIRRFILDDLLSERESASVTDEMDLQQSGILDSISTLKLFSFLESKFLIDLHATEIDERCFSSIANIEQLVMLKIRAR